MLTRPSSQHRPNSQTITLSVQRPVIFRHAFAGHQHRRDARMGKNFLGRRTHRVRGDSSRRKSRGRCRAAPHCAGQNNFSARRQRSQRRRRPRCARTSGRAARGGIAGNHRARNGHGKTGGGAGPPARAGGGRIIRHRLESSARCRLEKIHPTDQSSAIARAGRGRSLRLERGHRGKFWRGHRSIRHTDSRRAETGLAITGGFAICRAAPSGA